MCRIRPRSWVIGIPLATNERPVLRSSVWPPACRMAQCERRRRRRRTDSPVFGSVFDVRKYGIEHTSPARRCPGGDREVATAPAATGRRTDTRSWRRTRDELPEHAPASAGARMSRLATPFTSRERGRSAPAGGGGTTALSTSSQGSPLRRLPRRQRPRTRVGSGHRQSELSARDDIRQRPVSDGQTRRRGNAVTEWLMGRPTNGDAERRRAGKARCKHRDVSSRVRRPPRSNRRGVGSVFDAHRATKAWTDGKRGGNVDANPTRLCHAAMRGAALLYGGLARARPAPAASAARVAVEGSSARSPSGAQAAMLGRVGVNLAQRVRRAGR
jgi:hypothetical protein